MRAIVLSGGGAKGAYQIGVWRALRKLHIDYDIVVGTSVGALNGAMMVQKDYWKAVWLWKEMSYQVIFGETFDDNTFLNDDKVIVNYAKKVLKEGSMEVSGLETTIQKCLVPRKFFHSKVNYGLVTVKFPSMKPCLLQKKDIPKEKLSDYLVASASCFPAFKMKTIDNATYMDGGFYDNLPINLAIDMGATEIIAIDLEAVGRKQKVKDKSIPLTLIHPRNEIGSFLVFKKELTRRALCLGFYDTMKTFGKLDGEFYTFRKGTFKKQYEKMGEYFFSYLNTLLGFEKNKTLKENLLDLPVYKRLFSGEKEQTFYHALEKAGRIFEVDDERVYDMRKYQNVLKKKFYASWIDNFDSIEEELQKNKFQFLWNHQTLIHYLYYKIEEQEKKKTKGKLHPLALLFPEEFLAALYLKLLIETY